MQENEEILIEKLEDVNKEYLDSGYYELGKYIKFLMELLKKKRFIKFFQMVLLHFKRKKTKNNKNKIICESKKNKSNKLVVHSNSKHKIAIYTCITGDYDAVEEPIVVEDSCDYYLYTNNKEIKSDIWTVKEIPDEIIKMNDNNNAKINRYIKMHPKELFEKYDYAIYIDGNIKLISTISSFIDNINSKTGLAIHKHCVNNCIFDEIKTCRAYGKGNYKNLKIQAQRYKKEGFPENYGMFECNVLVSDLNNNKSIEIFNEWWNEYLKSESMRDQIALPYVLWKNKIQVEDIGCLGDNVNKNYKLKINSHI